MPKISIPLEHTNLLLTFTIIFFISNNLCAQNANLIDSLKQHIGLGNNLVAPKESNKTLQKATFFITHLSGRHSFSEDLEIRVASSSGILLARATITITNPQLYINNSHPYQLDILLPNLEKELCKGYIVSITRRSNENRPWLVHVRVELYFSDNYVLAADKDNVRFYKGVKKIEFQSF